MNDNMALNLIAEIMGWDDDDGSRATREYAWLRLMSAIKYDGYDDFRAGVRFVESLSTWLKQFKLVDRQVAYDFVKQRLVYISPVELQRLIEAFVPEVVTPNLRQAVASELSVKPYEVWRTVDGAATFNRHLRKTLFVGMSDGSRIDVLRRANLRLSAEQVVPTINVDNEKWRDLNRNLAEDSKNSEDSAKFDNVYLIDDFIASGTTFIRQTDGEWKGKLKKFNDLVLSVRSELGAEFPIGENYALHIHHYISSNQARTALEERLDKADKAWLEKSYGSVQVTEGLLLPKWLKLTAPADDAILDICERYYDHALYKRLEKHCRAAGQSDMKRGYADCALPIVLDHNTPNNSISLLWAETVGNDSAHTMRPLFRRRDRHG